MGYDSFAVRDVRLAQILQNARKFGVSELQNEAVVKALLNTPQFSLNTDERAAIEQIFVNLMKIEQEAQLSKI